MRNPKRIPEVVTIISNVWKKYPDLRLGQLLSNALCMGAEVDPANLFYIEDEKLIEMIKTFDKEVTEKRI